PTSSQAYSPLSMQTFARPGSAVTETMADRELHHQPRGVTRRFVAHALTAGALAGRLSHPLMTGAQEATAQGDAVAAGPPALALDRLGGDAWAWEKELTGSCPGCPPEATVALLVNGKRIAAERTDGRFRATARFDPGQNEAIAVATRPDGSEDRSAAVTYTVRLDPRPTARLAARIEADRLVIDGTESDPSEYDGAYLPTWSLQFPLRNPAPLNFRLEHPGVWSTPVPTVDGEYSVSLAVQDEHGRVDTAAVSFVVAQGLARARDPLHERAAWIADAVVYGVVPAFFDPPGFDGVTARLDDLRDLGVTALWLAPITRTIPDDFGYAVTDYFDVRPEYGSKDDFERLVAAAHARGIRVLMDFVPNHTSTQHPYALDAAANGEASAYWDFYDRDDEGTPANYFDWVHLPNLNYDNPDVGRFMLEAFACWVRELDVDGFRVDAVWGITMRTREWIADYLEAMYRLKPDALLIAEASARDPFYFEQGFAAAYDWSEGLGTWAWEEIFGGAAPIGEAMIDALTDGGQGYHEDALVMRFLNNNDTGPRFLTTHGVDVYRVALAMLLTLPGLPCLYTGDEVGAEYQPYDQSGPIDWDDRCGLRAEAKRLIELRRAIPALRSRQWLPLTVAPVEPFFAYLRTDDAGRSPVIILLNFSETDREATAELPETIAASFGIGEPYDLWSGETVSPPVNGRLFVSVPGWGFRFLVPGNA
ncbi:MAG: alpha-amylase family glycosyl hydrolase, partial [Thermomicrobiales bacterium]